jgi:SAM-dependent methyltransferase
MSSSVLDAQIAYYRARAAEYDEWFYRQGRYDYGDDLNRRWSQEVKTVRQVLLNLPPVSTALELACGTGIWTQELLKIAAHVTAIDASPEMLAINQAKVKSERVTYQQADLFNWQPEGRYDLVFFGFWLSHVPPDKLNPFLDKVARVLKPASRVFMIDSRKEPSSTARDMRLRDDDEIVLERRLNDGRKFHIIKVFYDPDTLAQHFRQAGLQPTVHLTEHYFLWATATKE